MGNGNIVSCWRRDCIYVLKFISNKFWDMIPTGLVKVNIRFHFWEYCLNFCLMPSQMLPAKLYSSKENDFVDPWYKDLPRDVSIVFPKAHNIDIMFPSSEFFLLTKFPLCTNLVSGIPQFLSIR
jgi:hypothetical protein